MPDGVPLRGRLAVLLVVLSAVEGWFCWENENCTRTCGMECFDECKQLDKGSDAEGYYFGGFCIDQCIEMCHNSAWARQRHSWLLSKRAKAAVERFIAEKEEVKRQEQLDFPNPPRNSSALGLGADQLGADQCTAGASPPLSECRFDNSSAALPDKADDVEAVASRLLLELVPALHEEPHCHELCELECMRSCDHLLVPLDRRDCKRKCDHTCIVESGCEQLVSGYLFEPESFQVSTINIDLKAEASETKDYFWECRTDCELGCENSCGSFDPLDAFVERVPGCFDACLAVCASQSGCASREEDNHQFVAFTMDEEDIDALDTTTSLAQSVGISTLASAAASKAWLGTMFFWREEGEGEAVNLAADVGKLAACPRELSLMHVLKSTSFSRRSLPRHM